MILRELITRWGFDVDNSQLHNLDATLNITKASVKALTVQFAAAGAAIGLVLNEAGKQEQTAVAFETMLGSVELAKQKLSELHQFASKTPFTIPGVETSAKQLLAMGIQHTNLIPTMKALGDVSAGLSVDLNRIAYNYGQVKSQTKLTGVELKDFVRAGVPLITELAKNLNVSEDQIKTMVSAGQIGFKDVEKAFRTMSSEGGTFANMMDKQSKTFFGLISNAKDYFTLILRSLGTEGDKNSILEISKGYLIVLLDWVEANEKLIKTKLHKVFESLVIALKAAVFVFLNMFRVLKSIVSLFGGLNNAIKIASIALASFTSLMIIATLGQMAMLLVSATRQMFGFGEATSRAASMLSSLFLSMGKGTLWGLALGAIVLILEDIYNHTQGNKSIVGALQEKFIEFFDWISDKYHNIIDDLKIEFGGFLNMIGIENDIAQNVVDKQKADKQYKSIIKDVLSGNAFANLPKTTIPTRTDNLLEKSNLFPNITLNLTLPDGADANEIGKKAEEGVSKGFMDAFLEVQDNFSAPLLR